MHSDFVGSDTEFVGAKSSDAVAECVGDFFAGHVVGFSVVPYGGDVGVVVGSGVGADALYKRSPLLDGAKGVVGRSPLGDGVKLASVLLGFESDRDIVGRRDQLRGMWEWSAAQVEGNAS